MKKRPVFTGGIALITATMIGNIFNFVASIYLGRVLSLENFGELTLFTSLLYILSIPLGSFSATLSHRIAYLDGKKLKNQAYEYLRYTLRKSIILGLIFGTLWVALIPVLDKFFQSDSFLALLFFTPLWFISVVGSNFSGYMVGTLSFGKKALVLLAESSTRLIASLLIVFVGLSDYIYASVLISMTASIIVGWFFTRKKQHKKQPLVNKSFNTRFFITSTVNGISLIAFLTLDIVLVKHFFDPAIAGQYGLLSLVGKMTYFFGALFIPFIIPLVAHNEGAKKQSKRIFLFLLAITLLFCGCSYLFLGVLGGFFVPIIFGAKALPIVPLLATYVLAMAVFTTMQLIVNYFQAKERYSFVLFGLLVAIFQVVGISLFHKNLAEVVDIMLYTSLINFVGIIILYLGKQKALALFRKVQFARLALKNNV